MVVPTGYVAGPLFVTEATLQLSAVIGVPNNTPDAVHDPASTFVMTLDGHVIVGFYSINI